MTTPTDDPQEQAALAIAQGLSGLVASLAALKQAGITGTGIIRRRADGFYESVDPLKVRFEIIEEEAES